MYVDFVQGPLYFGVQLLLYANCLGDGVARTSAACNYL